MRRNVALAAGLLSLLIVGNSTFNAASVFFSRSDFIVGSNPQGVALADFNLDGRLDLVVANVGSNSVSVLIGNQSGAFDSKTDNSVGGQPACVAVGDFNRDGKPDIAVANSSSNSLSVLLNTTVAGSPTATFAASVSFDTGTAPVSIAVGDFNGDGVADLATANSVANTVSILLGTVNGTFASRVDFNTNLEPRSITTDDLDRDGKPDVVVAATAANGVSVLLNKTALNSSNVSFGPAVPYLTGNGPVSVTIGDFNGDGAVDVATANPSSN